MKANELAKLAGITKDTLRYYEKMGVITQPKRGSNGYRLYSASHVRQLKFIKFGQSVGFTLNKIKLAIPHLDNPKPDCPELQRAITEQLTQIDEKIVELENAKETLKKWLSN